MGSPLLLSVSSYPFPHAIQDRFLSVLASSFQSLLSLSLFSQLAAAAPVYPSIHPLICLTFSRILDTANSSNPCHLSLSLLCAYARYFHLPLSPPPPLLLPPPPPPPLSPPPDPPPPPPPPPLPPVNPPLAHPPPVTSSGKLKKGRGASLESEWIKGGEGVGEGGRRPLRERRFPSFSYLYQ